MQDSAQVNELLSASYPKLMSSHYSKKTLMKALPSMCQANPKLLMSKTYYVAETPNDDGTTLVVGCGGWTQFRPGTEEVVVGLGHIRHFGVHPDFTRKGIGRLIFQTCVDDARAEGVNKFECYSSLNGETFYGALGFKKVGLVDVPMGPDLLFPSVVMTLDLM